MNLTVEHLPMLKAARQRIDSGASLAICLAIACAAEAPMDRALGQDITDHIEAELDGEAYLTDWVRFETGMDGRQPEHPTALRRGAEMRSVAEAAAINSARSLMRLAWLDKIIHDIQTK